MLTKKWKGREAERRNGDKRGRKRNLPLAGSLCRRMQCWAWARLKLGATHLFWLSTVGPEPKCLSHIALLSQAANKGLGRKQSSKKCTYMGAGVTDHGIS